MSQVLRVYFFGTKRTVSLGKQTSSPHYGVWRGVWGYLDPISHTQIHACPPCIPHKSQPLCKIPTEKNRYLKNKKWGQLGSCPNVARGCS